MEQDLIEIKICLGSSCFSRGNNKNMNTIMDYLSFHKLSEKCLVKGSLCEGSCPTGPHLSIDGEVYNNADPSAILDILDHYFKPRG